MEPLVVNGIGTGAERERRVLDALDAAGLRPAADFAARYPHELSGGQRQRVVIAGALVLEPEIIVADEPVSMLDVSIRTELLRLMLDLRAARGLTYLFITHDLSLAWIIADRIAVMYLGRIMEIGPAERVIRSPQNPYTRALVSVSPTPEPPTPGERARRTILVGETPGRRAHPDRLPLQPSLSERVRSLPGRGTTAHRRGRGPDERVLAGRGRTAPPGARHGPGRAHPDRCRAKRRRGSGPGLTRPATRGSRAPRPGWPGRLARAAHPATRGTAPRRAPAGPRRYRVPRRRPPRRAVRG